MYITSKVLCWLKLCDFRKVERTAGLTPVPTGKTQGILVPQVQYESTARAIAEMGDMGTALTTARDAQTDGVWPHRRALSKGCLFQEDHWALDVKPEIGEEGVEAEIYFGEESQG